MSVSFVSGAVSVRARFPLSVLAVACGLCSMTALQAAEEPVHELPPTVITAIQQSSPLTVVADPKDPRQPVPASDAADYLKTIPGFSAIRSGGSNSDPVLRGLFGSRLLLLTDGGQMIGACRWLLLPAFLCGSGFALIKAYEYQEKAAAGINFLTNDFYLFYYLITGMHFAHVLLGLPLLLYFAFAIRPGRIDAKTMNNLESSAIYWHMVDLLWIVIFPLIYLVQ